MSKELIDYHRNVSPSYNRGWGGPQYSDWMDEQMSWKQTCYIGDWSFLRDLVVEGPEALKLFSAISVNSFAKFDIGQAKHMIYCSERGKVIHQGILMRVGEQKFYNQSGSSWYTEFMLGKHNYDATCHIQETFNYQVSGPNALYVVEKVAGESLRDIKFMHFRNIKINGWEVIALRQGMAGEIGFELQGPKEYSEEIYNTILKVGKKFGIRRLGHKTAMINHLEGCYPTHGWHYLPDRFSTKGYSEFLEITSPGKHEKLKGSYEGNDISDYFLSPVEMGWTKNIKFDHEFIGRKALEIEVANPKRTVVTLEFNNDDMIDIYASLFRDGEPYEPMDLPHQDMWITWYDKVLKDGKLIGISTVPGYSYYFRKILTLTYIDIEFSKPGTEVIVVWGDPGKRQKQIRATVTPAPYKKHGGRIDFTKLNLGRDASKQ